MGVENNYIKTGKLVNKFKIKKGNLKNGKGNMFWSRRNS